MTVSDYQCSVCGEWEPYLIDEVIPYHKKVNRQLCEGSGKAPQGCRDKVIDLKHQCSECDLHFSINPVPYHSMKELFRHCPGGGREARQ